MKINFTLILLCFSSISFGQEIIEPCKFGQPLIDALQIDYTPNNPLGYGPARDILYSEIDNEGMDLSGIYTNFTVTLQAGADPSISAFDQGINAEHVYPQSLGASEEPMRSDLHNIFPSKVNVNATRGNCPFGEIDDSDTEAWYYLNMQLGNTPTMDIDNYSEKDEEDCVFEPRESVKGDIARAMFYFYSIYQTVADGINPSYLDNQKEVLYQWHLSDPADFDEMTRSGLIAGEQGNQNPFVLDSTLVRRAFFEADASYPEGDPNCYSLTTSIVNIAQHNWASLNSNLIQQEIIINSERNQGIIAVYDLQGRLIIQENLNFYNTISTNFLANGFYILTIQSGADIMSFKLFKN